MIHSALIRYKQITSILVQVDSHKETPLTPFEALRRLAKSTTLKTRHELATMSIGKGRPAAPFMLDTNAVCCTP